MNYRLVLPDEYIADLVRKIRRAEHRINMIALVISEDDRTRPIIDELIAASKRGVSVDIGLDLYFTFKEIGKSSNRWSYIRARTREMQATRDRLQQAGVTVRWLGMFGATLFSRRTHIKWTIIDDTVYSFGGTNLYADGIENIDYMFKIKTPRLAERMSAEHELVINTDKAGRSYPSHSIGVENGAVLVDGGRMFDSLIYRRACDLAEQAERVWYVSQFCPSGRLAKILRRSDTEFYFNDWHRVSDRLNKILILSSSLVHRITTGYARPNYLHAKFMLFQMVDGSLVALSGSHNFVANGGRLGTREVALETRDPHVIEQLQQFLDAHVR